MRVIKENRHPHKMQSAFKQNNVAECKLTSFCVPKETDEGVLLCHTVTGELILLTNEEYQAVRSMRGVSSALAEQLMTHAFLVDKASDEYALVDKERQETLRYQKREQQDNPGISGFTILPTTRCNAQCFYCYEHDIPQKNMSVQTAEDVAAFITEHCKEGEADLHWFGGEPTVAHRVIRLICARLAQNGVQFKSSMISNGFLLDKKMIAEAKELWNLKSVQITIDGTESVYRAAKNYKSRPENPLQTVFSNIDCLTENAIRVSVRMNLGSHNIEDVSALIDQLARRYAQNPHFRAYVREITNYYDFSRTDALLEQSYLLNRRLIQLHLQQPSPLPSLRLRSCMADSEDSVLINPDGRLGKCEHFSYDKLHGSIYTQEHDEGVLAKWKERLCFDECKTCPFYASCFILVWCNGGVVCNARKIRIKTLETQDAMLSAFLLWKHRLMKLRTGRVLLSTRLEFKRLNDREFAEFYIDKQKEPVKIIPVNETAKDILSFLLKNLSFREIVEAFLQKYAVGKGTIEMDVEDYLIQLLDMGLCQYEQSSKLHQNTPQSVPAKNSEKQIYQS